MMRMIFENNSIGSIAGSILCKIFIFFKMLSLLYFSSDLNHEGNFSCISETKRSPQVYCKNILKTLQQIANF